MNKEISPKYQLEYFKKLVETSESLSDISYKLHNNNLYGNRQTIKRYIDLYKLDTIHFNTKKKNYGVRVKKDLTDILIEFSTFDTTHLKHRLYNEGLKKRECELCGQDENWKGKKISLILDHINGINNDNRLGNLRVVCPNCNATLDTHCKGRIEKEEKIASNSNEARSLKQRTKERPSYEDLTKSVNEIGFSKTGEKYNVSDNSIRKWIKYYIKNEEKENVLNIKI